MPPDMENSVRKEAKPGRGNDIRRWFLVCP